MAQTHPMSRRRTSAVDGLLALVALLPWWAGVALAALAYLVLHAVASQPVASPVPGQLSATMSRAIWRGLATAGQYALPLVCLAGAAMSWWRRRERRGLVKGVSAAPGADALNGMSWRQFEKLVGEVFRMQGYQVVETGGMGPDGGMDLMLRRDRETHLVQCKQWKAYKVGVETVRELYGVMAAKGATGGFVVTSGRFSREASQFAAGLNIRLIDGPVLHDLIMKLDGAQSGTIPGARAATPTTVTSDAPPACPVCTRLMVRRVAKRGERAGQPFWGCTGYPSCRGTRPH
jgi:restriction system protein